MVKKATKKSAKRRAVVETETVVITAEQFLNGVNAIKTAVETLKRIDANTSKPAEDLELEVESALSMSPSVQSEDPSTVPLYGWIDLLARKVNDVNALSFKTRNQVTGRIATQLVPMEDGEAKRKSFGESKDKLIGALAILDLIWRDLSKIQDYVTLP